MKDMNVPIHMIDAPKNDKSEDSEIVKFNDKNITPALPDERKHLKISKLVKKVKTLHQSTICRKKNGVTCRFNAP